MKLISIKTPFNWLAVSAFCALLAPEIVQGYPPAPTHTIFGIVRNEYGEPFYVDGATVIFETTNGQQVTSTIVPGLDPGINYRLGIAMDSGIASDNYKTTAFKTSLPFLIKVKVGSTVYLPIEMSGSYATLGKPAASTRIDLTLGVDSDLDGLPDSWEQLLIAMLGSGSLASIQPGDDSDGDGMSNRDEYLSGTYAFDPSDRFILDQQRIASGAPYIKFPVLNNHTYTLYYSSDLKTWTPMNVKLTSDGPGGVVRPYYESSDIRTLEVEPVISGGVTNSSYHYRVLVQ